MPATSTAAIDRERRRSPERSREWRAAHPEKNRAKNAKWKEENRDKHLAHKAVEYALRSGRLERKPCERCGTTKLVHAHHDDYTKRLDVMWLCPTDHRARHRELDTIRCEQIAA